jgi:hypothetical protein
MYTKFLLAGWKFLHQAAPSTLIYENIRDESLHRLQLV